MRRDTTLLEVRTFDFTKAGDRANAQKLQKNRLSELARLVIYADAALKKHIEYLITTRDRLSEFSQLYNLTVNLETQYSLLSANELEQLTAMMTDTCLMHVIGELTESRLTELRRILLEGVVPQSMPVLVPEVEDNSTLSQYRSSDSDATIEARRSPNEMEVAPDIVSAAAFNNDLNLLLAWNAALNMQTTNPPPQDIISRSLDEAGIDASDWSTPNEHSTPETASMDSDASIDVVEVYTPTPTETAWEKNQPYAYYNTNEEMYARFTEKKQVEEESADEERLENRREEEMKQEVKEEPKDDIEGLEPEETHTPESGIGLSQGIVPRRARSLKQHIEEYRDDRETTPELFMIIHDHGKRSMTIDRSMEGSPDKEPPAKQRKVHRKHSRKSMRNRDRARDLHSYLHVPPLRRSKSVPLTPPPETILAAHNNFSLLFAAEIARLAGDNRPILAVNRVKDGREGRGKRRRRALKRTVAERSPSPEQQPSEDFLAMAKSKTFTQNLYSEYCTRNYLGVYGAELPVELSPRMFPQLFDPNESV